MHELEGCGPVRRFAWQIGGLGVALGACVVLGVLAFGCGAGSPARSTATASPTPHPTATADPRVAQVDAAVRRYVQALVDAMRTGSPTELDSLSVPGSQAEGNAGITAHVVQGTGKAFVTRQLQVSELQITLAASTDAMATVSYAMTGYDASWPSLKQLDSDHVLTAKNTLELQFVDGQWLVAVQH